MSTYLSPWPEIVLKEFLRACGEIHERNGYYQTLEEVRLFDSRDTERRRARAPSVEIAAGDLQFEESGLGAYRVLFTLSVEVSIYQRAEDLLGTEVLVQRAIWDVLKAISDRTDFGGEIDWIDTLRGQIQTVQISPLKVLDPDEPTDGAELTVTVATNLREDLRTPVDPDSPQGE